jgi:signal transduction histidine kinase
MSMLEVFATAWLPVAGRTGIAFLEEASRALVTGFGARLCVIVERSGERVLRPAVAFAGTELVETLEATEDHVVLEARCRDLLGAAAADLAWHLTSVDRAAAGVLVDGSGAVLDEPLRTALSFVATRASAEIARAKRERRAALDSRLGLLREVNDELVWNWHLATGRVEWSDALLAEGTTTYDEWRRRVHPGDRDRIDAAFGQLRDGVSDRWEDHYRYVHGNGSTRIAQIRAVLERRQDGRPIRVIGSFQDVTDEKAHEQRMILAERMAAMGTLAAGVAHEINNPLAYVKGNVEHVLEELRGVSGIDADLKAALEEAREGAERMRRIVQDLRLFSRPQDVGVAPVDVDRVVESALTFVATDVQRRARLVKVLRSPPPVDANETKLGHVLLALMVNAIHALPEGAAATNTVDVETGVDEAGRVFILVRDTGAGIPAEIIGRIFDPFFTTKPVGEGTGLGLSIAHSIISSLGGEITVDSAPGAGTTFRVTLAASARSE